MSGSWSATSTTGMAKPTESACSSASSWGKKDVREEVSVRPKPLPTRALGNAFMIACTASAAIGAPPYETQRTWLRSVCANSGCQVVDRQRLARRQLRAWPEHVGSTRVRHHVVDLGILEAGVDGNRHRSGELDPPERQHPIHAVWKQDRRAIAALEPRGSEPPCDACGTVPEFGVRQVLASHLRDRHRIGISRCARAQHVDERVWARAVTCYAVRAALDTSRVEGIAAPGRRLHCHCALLSSGLARTLASSGGVGRDAAVWSGAAVVRASASERQACAGGRER